jgi:glycosyltransferase involved in cell wall biosynthesis
MSQPRLNAKLEMPRSEKRSASEAARPAHGASVRVVHFCRAFSNLSETFIYDYVTELERQGLDNQVITFDRQNESTRPFEKVQVLKRPGPRHPVNLAVRLFRKIRRQSDVDRPWAGCATELLRAARRYRPQIIHAHFGWEAAMIAPVARRMRVPLVVTFYGYDISSLPVDSWWRHRFQRLWSEAAAIVVLSRNMAEAVARLGCPAQNVHVVHLARRLGYLKEPAPRVPVRKFLSVGRLVEKKGHLDAIRAIHQVAKIFPDVQLEIVGEGPLRPQIEETIHTLGLERHVHLCGALPSQETLHLMHRADGFLLCSRTGANGDKEGTPTVLVEAQSIGIPLVTTAHAGIPEMLPEENRSLLAAEGNVAQIVQRLEWLMNCDEVALKSMVCRGQKFVQIHFDLSSETSKLIDLYRTLAIGN